MLLRQGRTESHFGVRGRYALTSTTGDRGAKEEVTTVGRRRCPSRCTTMGRASTVAAAVPSREGHDVADGLDPGEIAEQPVKTQAEAAVWRTTPAAEVGVPGQAVRLAVIADGSRDVEPPGAHGIEERRYAMLAHGTAGY